MRRRFRTLILFRPWWFRLPGTSPGRLTGGDIRDTDPIRERYTKALNWLRDVADGKAGIPGLPPAGTETPGAVLLEPGTRPWDGVTP